MRAQEQLDERLYGRGTYLGRGTAAGAAGDDILDAIVRQGGLTLTWGDKNKLPDDLWADDGKADTVRIAACSRMLYHPATRIHGPKAGRSETNDEPRDCP